MMIKEKEMKGMKKGHMKEKEMKKSCCMSMKKIK